MNTPQQNSIKSPIVLSNETLQNKKIHNLKINNNKINFHNVISSYLTYSIIDNVQYFIAIIRVTNKTHMNNSSNNIMFGIQHNFRHFQGEVGFTRNKCIVI